MDSKLEEKMYRENLEFAPIDSRILAFIIDIFLTSLLFTLIFWDLIPKTEEIDIMMAFTQKFILPYLGIYFGYEFVFVYFYGASLGKIILKIKVIDIATLDTLSPPKALLRALVKIIGCGLYFAPFCLVFFLDSKQALHDLLAKSIVIKNA